MNKYSVIIPSAVLMPKELQNIGKLPGIIYPINSKIVFDYIYEQYCQICNEIKVVCFEEKEKVHVRLESYKKSLRRGIKLDIIDMPVLEDLGYTVYYALNEIENNNVIINFADTIVLDSIPEDIPDLFFYTEESVSSTWTYIDLNENGVISQIYDKTENNIEGQKNLFVGVIKLSNASFFKHCLEEAFQKNTGKISKFYYALLLYSKQYKLAGIKAEEWFDIGHSNTYFNSKIEVKAREFNYISIDKNRGILRKNSREKEKFIGEILWYLKLPLELEYIRPRIFSYSTEYGNPYISMEYYAYHTLHELYINGDLDSITWNKIFQKVLFVHRDLKKYAVSDEIKIQNALKDMYLNKTVQRFKKMREDKKFCNFFTKPITVNGKQYRSLNEIESCLKEIIPRVLYYVETFHIIHGELCFANMMIDNNFSFIKLIDPRGKFGDYDIYGDTRYELAKLMHSVEGKYDFIIKDLCEVNYDLENSKIVYSIVDKHRRCELYEIFLNVFKEEIGNDLKKIRLIEALLFFNMIPLHKESITHQMAMLGTAIELLDKVMQDDDLI